MPAGPQVDLAAPPSRIHLEPERAGNSQRDGHRLRFTRCAASAVTYPHGRREHAVSASGQRENTGELSQEPKRILNAVEGLELGPADPLPITQQKSVGRDAPVHYFLRQGGGKQLIRHGGLP
jgi:hypothetical protein